MSRISKTSNLRQHIFPCSDNEIHNYLSISTGYKEFIPFKYPAPIDEEAAKKKKKGGKNKQEE